MSEWVNIWVNEYMTTTLTFERVSGPTEKRWENNCKLKTSEI